MPQFYFKFQKDQGFYCCCSFVSLHVCFAMTLKLKRPYLFYLLTNGSVVITIIDYKVYKFFVFCFCFFLSILYGFRSCRLDSLGIIKQSQSELKNYQRIILFYCKLPAIRYHPIIHSRNCYIFVQLLYIVQVSFTPFQIYSHPLYNHYSWCIISLCC